MLAEGIHSIIDTGNGFLLLLGIKKGCKICGPDASFWIRKRGIFLEFCGKHYDFCAWVEGLPFMKECMQYRTKLHSSIQLGTISSYFQQLFLKVRPL